MCRQLRKLVAQRLAAPLAAMSLEPTKNTKGYEIVEELWRIVSYYSLHADPTSPETLKVANFMKFAKDCQILSNKLIPSTVELELSKSIDLTYLQHEYPLTQILFLLTFSPSGQRQTTWPD